MVCSKWRRSAPHCASHPMPCDTHLPQMTTCCWASCNHILTQPCIESQEQQKRNTSGEHGSLRASIGAASCRQMCACCKWQAQKGEERVTLGSSLEKASARLLLNSAATLPNIECRSAGNRMGDNTCTTWSTDVTCMLSMPQSLI